MSTYLEKYPPRAWQMGPTVNGVRVTTSATCVLHTYEADWPASQGANYIRTRSNSAGYHHLTGLDQDIHLAPWRYATAHAIPVNVWAKGFSCMWFAGRWSQLSRADRRTLVHGMAKGVHEYSRWRVRNGMAAIRARKISRAQAMRGENGIVYHGDLQSDRTDPGSDFPLREFMAEFRRLESGGTTTAGNVLEGEVMTTPYELWAYENDDVDTRQVYTMLRNAASDVLWDRTYDYANPDGDATSLRHQVSRAHQYSLGARNLSDRRLDYINSENPTTARHQIARAHQYAMNASQRAREANEKIDAVAEAVAELVGQIDQNTRKALEDKLAAIKTESARANAEEVAAELEVSAKEEEED